MASVINFTHLRYLVNLEVLMVSLVFPEWPGVEVDGACVWSVVWDRDRELGGSWVPGESTILFGQHGPLTHG